MYREKDEFAQMHTKKEALLLCNAERQMERPLREAETIEREKHKMAKKKRRRALQTGVLHVL